MKAPSKKQIDFADEIARTLNLDFPRGDYDYTAQGYFLFIQKHIKEYYEYEEMEKLLIPLGEDDNDIFFGYTEGLWEY